MPMHPEYRARWDVAGYGLKMGSSEVVLPPPPELLRVYHFTSADHAISDIALGRLKVARFADLNDPFELLSVNLGDHRIRRLVTSFKATYNQQAGLLCFSGDWTSPALWSHYGARHTGICLGFSVPRHQIQAVIYKDERPDAQLGENLSPLHLDPILRNQLLVTKSRDWSYEQESRMVVDLGKAKSEDKLFFRSFDQELHLVEVILGPYCKLALSTVRSQTTALYPAAVVFGTRLAIKWFNIVPDEKTVP